MAEVVAILDDWPHVVVKCQVCPPGGIVPLGGGLWHCGFCTWVGTLTAEGDELAQRRLADRSHILTA